MEAWASLKSFRCVDAAESDPPEDPGNPTVNFHGERRRNDTHQSTTDPEAMLHRKGKGKEAKLAYLGHVLLDNRRRDDGAALGGRRRARSRKGVPSGERVSRYAGARRCPSGARRAAGTRGIVRDGCVVVNRAAAEFQQRTGHPLDVGESEYEILFEEGHTMEDFSLGLWFRVNQYTGEGAREIGSAPYGTFSFDSDNVYNHITCEPYPDEERL